MPYKSRVTSNSDLSKKLTKRKGFMFYSAFSVDQKVISLQIKFYVCGQ